MKTLKGWNRSNKDLDEYLGNKPIRIDEALALYIAEVVPSEYCSQEFIQGGDAEDKIDGHYTYMTVRQVNSEYFYLGVLPSFKGPYNPHY